MSGIGDRFRGFLTGERAVRNRISTVLDEIEQLEDKQSARRSPESLSEMSSKSDQYVRFGSALIPLEEIKHVVMVGAPGTGKTLLQEMTLSSVLDLLKNDPKKRVVIIDIKGDKRSFLEGHGVPYAMLSVDYEEGYSPDIAKDFNSYTQLSQLGFQVVAEGKSNEPFWSNSARALFSGIPKSFLYTQGSNSYHLHDILCLLHEDLPTVLKVLKQFPDNRRVVETIFTEHSEKTAAGVMAHLASEMEKLAHVGGHSQKVGKYISVREFLYGSKPPAQVLLITQRQSTMAVTNPLIGLLFDRMTALLSDCPENKDENGNELPPWCFFFCDELAAQARYTSLRRFVTFLRSRGVVGVFATQGISGPRRLYGDEIDEILGCCEYQVFCKPPRDAVTPEWMSQVFGKNQISQFVPTSFSVDNATGRISASATTHRYEQNPYSSGDFVNLPLASKETGITAIFCTPLTGGFKGTVAPELVERYKKRRRSVAPLHELSVEKEYVSPWSAKDRARFLGMIDIDDSFPVAAAAGIGKESRPQEVESEAGDAHWDLLCTEVVATLVKALPTEPIGEVWMRCKAMVQERFDKEPFLREMAEKRRRTK